MLPRGYYAIFYKEKGSDNVQVDFPEHPNVFSWGRDWEHAKETAAEGLSIALEEDFKLGFKLPPASRPKAKPGQRVEFIPIKWDVYIAYLIRHWREEAGLTQLEMAERLGIKQQSYQRMERPGRSNLTLATLERIVKALGMELVMDARSRYPQESGQDGLSI